MIRYLRREKDIVDLQLEFSKQEATRLRQQLEFATRNLEESRQALVEVGLLKPVPFGDSALTYFGLDRNVRRVEIQLLPQRSMQNY